MKNKFNIPLYKNSSRIVENGIDDFYIIDTYMRDVIRYVDNNIFGIYLAIIEYRDEK